MRLMLLIAASCCAAHAARADHSTFMRADFQVFDGSGWSNEATVSPGATVQCRIEVSWDLAAGNGVSFGVAAFNQIDVSGTAASDLASGFSGMISPTNAIFALINAGTSTAKLDRTNPQTGPFQLGQGPLDNGGVAGNPIVVIQFDYVTALDQPLSRDIIFGLSAPAQFSQAGIFTSSAGATASVPLANRSFDGATIHVIPAPGTMISTAGLIGLRRRRNI